MFCPAGSNYYSYGGQLSENQQLPWNDFFDRFSSLHSHFQYNLFKSVLKKIFFFYRGKWGDLFVKIEDTGLEVNLITYKFPTSLVGELRK